ncbi:kinase-like protein [Zopfia rhizophila CBS 207.26]|uniref:Kinase-like protein n=1 Tax=Zopfia rhizophila CBS 207.26 TaxID=1314779 RepID=A0A6A6E9D5_9PEZI|nr:kinase-like protein [Zopfia rhizophila CBS 207.26]
METVRWPLKRRAKDTDHNSSPLTSSLATKRRKTFPSGIKLLHDAQNSTVDIIFVHGLTGDREKTWTANSAATPWPQALLPGTLPTARILTFGYDAYVADWQGIISKNRIGNYSMDLLTAVAAYRENNNTALATAAQKPESHLQSILHSTRGIIFLGTPHHGLGLAKWAEVVSRSIGVLKQKNAQTVAVIESDSEVLARVQDSFHTLIRSRRKDGLQSIEMSFFFEELPLPGVGVAVPQRSAVLSGYIPIGVRSNHIDMAKFEDKKRPRVYGSYWRASFGFAHTISPRQEDKAAAIAPSPVLICDGTHLDIATRDALPYKTIKGLGMGSSAFVELVHDVQNGREFAHKVFRRYYGPDVRKYQEAIQNELRIIRRLSPHPHIIHVFATYTCGREFGMILTPAADSGDLATYFQNILDSEYPITEEQRVVLERAFGCLASGLAFIHEHTIRHKDIKPQNILIHQRRIIYTDFGIALDATERNNNTTTLGKPLAFTPRYCAPEVADWDKRNRKSDIFSLGCVFVEILSALERYTKLEGLRTDYYRILDDLRDALGSIRQSLHAYGSARRGPLLNASAMNVLQRNALI